MKNLTINVGDYVRTRDGIILKVKDIEDIYTTDNIYIGMSIYDNEGHFVNDVEIIKSSSNITDLIEVGDLLFVDVDNDYKGGIIVPRISETQNELDLMIGFIKNGSWILKGIVTREQIENMEYKIER